MSFKYHERVLLKANAEEGIPEEKGVVLDENGPQAGIYTVLVDDEYVGHDVGDDGLREVSENMVEKLEEDGGETSTLGTRNDRADYLHGMEEPPGQVLFLKSKPMFGGQTCDMTDQMYEEFRNNPDLYYRLDDYEDWNNHVIFLRSDLVKSESGQISDGPLLFSLPEGATFVIIAIQND